MEQLRYINERMRAAVILLLLFLMSGEGVCAGVKGDFVVKGVYEASLDLPRIYFKLKRGAEGPFLGAKGENEANYAFLDTGASGILLSRETAEQAGVAVEAKAQFGDIGAGGKEYFNVSEPLYLWLGSGEAENPENAGIYRNFGQGRFMVKKIAAGALGEPIDIVGMPVMFGRVVVLNSGATNSLGYFAADIKNKGEGDVPKTDIEVGLGYEKFVEPGSPNNVPPLPTLSYNPVIDNIVISNKGKESKANWLFDTGATVSFISTKQAKKLGLMDQKGKALVKADFTLPMGGVGEMIMIDGFEVDELRVPTLSGGNIVFKKARIGVHDVEYFDEDKGKSIILDGVFGSNFLCASAKMEGMLPSDIGETAFEHIVLDMSDKRVGKVGFEVKGNKQK